MSRETSSFTSDVLEAVLEGDDALSEPVSNLKHFLRDVTRETSPEVVDALGGNLASIAQNLAEAASFTPAPSRADATNAALTPAQWMPVAAHVEALTSAQQQGAAAEAAAPGMESSAIAAVKTTGYSAQSNTGQWYIPAMFGGSAAKAQSVLSQFNGQGVAVADYDDGIDKSVTALKANYDASKELVINGKKADPGILSGSGSGVHGTATAGIISADAGSNGGTMTGLAYGAKLTAVNIFSGVAASNFTTAIRMMSNFDVTNNSWGWTSKWADSTSTSFGSSFVSALKYASDSGRGGLGTNIVHAAGNEWGTDKRNINSSQFGADRHVINVAAISSNGDVSYYSNRGSALLVGASSGGNTNQYIMTTDRTGSAGYASGDVTNTFNGTSAAAPQITALVADMLSANSKLGWRDVQNILALTARDVETSTFTKSATGQMAYGWDINKAIGVNGGGYHYSNDVGFGLADGFAAVRMAEVWSYFKPTPATSANEQRVSASAAGAAVSSGVNGTSFTFKLGQSISIENVNLNFNITTKNLNNLSVSLTGPMGTQSLMLGIQGGAAASVSNFSWSLNSRAFLGELSAGTWTVTFKDTVAADAAKINSLSLDVYGSTVSNQHVFHYTDEVAMMQAYDPSRIAINDPTGVNNWMNLAATTGAANINLASGASSTLGGRTFATIGATTKINNVALGDGAATVVGNNNGNTFVAGRGAATILGGTGNDTFYAGWANDVFTGGAGKDTYAFNRKGFGQDTITDFVKGQDKISLKGIASSLAQLAIADTGSQITITSTLWAATDKIVLTNTKNQHLASTDFAFA